MIKKIKLSTEEKESFIYLAPLEPNGKALVYTTEPVMLKKMWKLHNNHPDDVTIRHDDKYGTEFYIPMNWIDIKPKKKLTEAERLELVKRFSKPCKNPSKK